MRLASVLVLVGAFTVVAPAQATVRSDRGGIHKIAMKAYAHKYEVIVGSGAGPLMYGGGRVQKSPKVYITYWGWTADPAGVRPYLNAFMKGVGGSSWAGIQTQYTDSGGSIGNPTSQLKGTWDDNSSTPAAVIPAADVQAEAIKSVNHFGYDPDASYFIASPTGHATSDFPSKGGSYCAWHDRVVDNGRDIAYTNLPYMPDAAGQCGQGYVNTPGLLDGVSIVAGHEYAESVTDPAAGDGWIDVASQENGDKCAWIQIGPGKSQNIQLSTGIFAVQTLYSNAANFGVGSCVISYP
jgi:hypothetical protein